MRKTTLLAAAATLVLATAASAQQQPAQQPSPAPAAPAPAAPGAQPQAPTIQAINVVDIKDLPADTQAKVNEVIAKRSDADLQKLRGSIDATPQVKSALEAKGLTSAQVIAASMSTNGALTLITKKAS
ncbi:MULTISPECIES: hypothetical protein [unclassified Mesorhizobium]|uniref:hypothetical protein n=1 Tax=unclassified Mesorhizobium TaxID=325217 RepID=UPI0003CF7E4A|nr:MULTISPECIES: hypothetical protein [unclassified Mesorhizobium]ESW85105.1 hypothetical protein X772_15805 [Mesorhizobium sp. LSJC280B00]MCP9228763.1 hypothetical protein [Mesorhizobium sp. LMG 17147]TIT22028.1 MAG: hypothetical protein E5W70_14480 [Mesorhizobium sp.]